MRTVEIIESEISALKEELEKVKKEQETFAFVCDKDSKDHDIGFFSLGNTKKILLLLVEGKTLQYRHEYLGTVDVVMNPQKNRVLVSDNSPITEEAICSHILGLYGSWFVYKNK